MAQLYSPEKASLDLLKVFAQFNKYVSYSFFLGTARLKRVSLIIWRTRLQCSCNKPIMAATPPDVTVALDVSLLMVAIV